MITAVHRLLTEPTFGHKAAGLRRELEKWPGAAWVMDYVRTPLSRNT